MAIAGDRPPLPAVIVRAFKPKVMEIGTAHANLLVYG